MKKMIITMSLALLATGNAFSQPKNDADPKLLSNIKLMAQYSLENAKNFANIADDANDTRTVCMLVEAPLLGAEAVAAAFLFGAPAGAAATAKVSIGAAGGAWVSSAGGMASTVLLAAESAFNRNAPQKAKQELASVVAQINLNHKASDHVGLALINKNLQLLKAEKDKVFANEMNGSLKNAIKDHVTCGSLSRKGSAKLAEIAVTEYNYLTTVYRALHGGFPVRLDTARGDSDQYADILFDLEFLNFPYFEPTAADVRQTRRTTASVRSKESSSESTKSEPRSASAN